MPLGKHDLNIEVADDERAREIVRHFILENGDSIRRIYPADYSQASLKAMLRMLGFSLRSLPRRGTSAFSFSIISVFCYDDDYARLIDLAQALSEKEQDHAPRGKR